MAQPAVISPVGVNKDIVQDSVNGFLADSHEEWVDKLSKLIESPELRDKLGQAGRQTVIAKYSAVSWQGQYIKYFQGLISQ